MNAEIEEYFYLLREVCRADDSSLGTAYRQLRELIVGYAAPELIGSEKEILHPVLLRAARRTAGCRNRESQIQVLRQQIVDNCGLARPGGGGKYNQFTHLWYLLFNGLLFNPLIGLL